MSLSTKLMLVEFMQLYANRYIDGIMLCSIPQSRSERTENASENTICNTIYCYLLSKQIVPIYLECFREAICLEHVLRMLQMSKEASN